MRAVGFVTLGVAVATLSACQQAPKPLTPADKAAIRAVDSALVAALNAGDVAAATEAYAADGMVMPPARPPSSGSDAIRQLWSGLTGQIAINFTIRSERIAGEGNVAYHIGSYHFTGTMKDSTHAALPPENGKYLQVFMRQADGSWKVAAEAWSANTPSAPPALPPSRRH
jgi:uncharacterized protein (TIGR02246 family)